MVSLPPVGYSPGTPYPTGDKYTISAFVDRTHIQRLAHLRRKAVFFKTSLPVLRLKIRLLPNFFFRK